MQTAFTLAALASVAFALPQGGPVNKAPESPSPAGCSKSSNGNFQITIVNGSTTATPKRQASTCGQEGLLTASLADGVLTDSKGRIGSIVANYQFQFDGPPPQAGALYTSGFSVCQNGSLAIGGSAVFYSCASGEFSNLYDRAWAPQCLPVFINVLPCSGSSSGAAGEQPDGQPSFTGAAPPVSQIGDGQPQGTSVVAPPATQIGDGQVQVPTTAPMAPVTQIGDGQLQVPTTAPAAPVTQIGDGQVQVPTTAPKAPVTQIGDGQVQVPTTAPAAPVTQIGDGQVQVPTSAPKAPVTQIGDGQVQVPTSAPAAPVTQIGDGQVQVPTSAPKAPVTQIGDGQIQVPTTAPKPAGTPVTQIGDGQIQVPTSAPKPSGTPVVQIGDGQLKTNTTTPITVGANAGNSLNVAGSMATVMVGLAAVLLL